MDKSVSPLFTFLMQIDRKQTEKNQNCNESVNHGYPWSVNHGQP